jgi:ABC-type transport system involved in multi-copper enzyme maturation permease subunit
MIRQIRSELTKLATTWTVAAIDLALVVLVAAAVALHAAALPLDKLDSGPLQRGVLIDVGVNLGGLFAALLGALIFTGEVRTGTIRPTLLVVPTRRTVMVGKAVAAALAGALTAAIAAAVAVGAGAGAFSARDGLSFAVQGSEVIRLVMGSVGVGALLSLLGLAVGALVRSQVPVVVGIFAWLLFIENLMADLPSVHRFAPGALAQAMAGQVRGGVLGSAWSAAGMLAVYAAACFTLSTVITARRDFA